MTANAIQIIAACFALVMLTCLVGIKMLFSRVSEMREKRIHPQGVATSVQMTARLENVQASDNFRNLFEVPVLFYALAVMALATGHTPGWLVVGSWLFVALRVIHSLIHCTYNKVMHRLSVFLASFIVVVALWIAFFLTLASSVT